MTGSIEKGTWVEIRRIVLPAGQRAPQVPDDTQQVPLEMKVKGFLVTSATLGEEAEIETASGRRLTGTVTQVNPAYSHGFGPPIPELSAIAAEVRTLLRNE
jgi:hypothetical protein